MPNWPLVELGSVLPFKYGKSLPERCRNTVGNIDVVSSAGISGKHDEAFVYDPCIVVGRKGSIGTIYYCSEPVWPIDTTFYVTASDAIDLKFAKYLLQTLPLSSMNNDSAVPGLNRAQAEAIQVALPTLDEQRAIAATLGALDAKIETNRRLIDLIPSLISAHVGEAAARESELIPVSRLATFVNGGAYTKGATGTGRMVLRIAELNKGPGSSTIYNDIEVPEDKLARPGNVLMSWSGSLGVYRWARDEAIVNQHIFKVIPRDFPDWLVFDRLKEVMPIFQGHAADKATTMGHIQRGHLDSTQVAIPAASDVIKLDRTLSPLWQRLLLAEREVLHLVQLRDALLPELLSGRMKTGEIDA